MRWADNVPDDFTLAIQKKTATSAFPGQHTETGAILAWSECSGDGSAYLKDCVGVDARGTIAVPAVLNTFTGEMAGTTLTVSAVATGTIEVNDIITGTGVADNTRVTALGTGTGGTGTYTISTSQTVASRAMSAIQRGSAWGLVTIATANAGTAGTLFGAEFGIVNNSVAAQPLVDTTTSTYGILIAPSGNKPITAALRAGGSSNTFYHGLWMSAADIVATAGASYLHYDDSFGNCLFCVSYTGGLTGQAATFAGTVTSTVAGPSFTASNVSTPYYRATDGTRQAHFGVDSANATHSGFALSGNGFRILTNNGSTTALTADASGVVTAPSFTTTSTGSTTAVSLANRFAQRVSVLDFGANNTGTPQTATNINLAIAAAVTGGNCVWFPPGTYLVTTVILILPGSCIEGPGGIVESATGAAVLKVGANLTYFITTSDAAATNTHSFIMRNLTVDGNRGSFTTTALVTVGLLNGRIEGNYIANGSGDCVYNRISNAPDTGPAWIYWISRNTIGNCGGWGINNQGSDGLISENYVSGNTAGGILLNTQGAVRVNSNQIEVNTGYGLKIIDPLWAPSQALGNTIVGNEFNQNGTAVWYAKSANYTVSAAANNGGAFQLTLNSTTGITTGDLVRVTGVAGGGATAANGYWIVTVNSGTLITLQGSTYSAGYTSGGTIGYSSMPVSGIMSGNRFIQSTTQDVLISANLSGGTIVGMGALHSTPSNNSVVFVSGSGNTGWKVDGTFGKSVGSRLTNMPAGTVVTTTGTGGQENYNVSAIATASASAVVITGTGAVDGSSQAPLSITTSASNPTFHFLEGAQIFAPSMVASDYIGARIGRVINSNYDSGYLAFKYAGANSTSNKLVLGFWNNADAFTLDGLGNGVFTGGITATGAITSTLSGAGFVASNVSTPYYRATDGTRSVNFGIDTADTTNSTFINASNGLRLLTNNGATTALTLTAAGAATVSGTLSATIASTAQTNVACYNSGTGLFTYQTWATGCLASSARFKENITVRSNADALKVVTALEPVTFTYKKSADMGSEKHNGFIAEQVVKVAPDLVDFEKDGKTPRAVKYQEMAPYFAGAIRELKTANDNLKAANDNLKAEIAELKKKVR